MINFIDHSERDSSNEDVNEEKEDVKESSEGIINHRHVLPKYSFKPVVIVYVDYASMTI